MSNKTGEKLMVVCPQCSWGITRLGTSKNGVDYHCGNCDEDIHILITKCSCTNPELKRKYYPTCGVKTKEG